MEINDILSSLGIDLTNPEARRGAVEAIQAILNSRMPPPDISSAASVPGEKKLMLKLTPIYFSHLKSLISLVVMKILK